MEREREDEGTSERARAQRGHRRMLVGDGLVVVLLWRRPSRGALEARPWRMTAERRRLGHMAGGRCSRDVHHLELLELRKRVGQRGELVADGLEVLELRELPHP
eukprot:881420-Prymnesium_polylepis.1